MTIIEYVTEEVSRQGHGLVHTMNFRVRKGKIQFQLFRNEHATKQLRKAEGRNP